MKYIYFNIQNIKYLDCFHTNFNGPDSLSSKSDKCFSRTGTNIHKHKQTQSNTNKQTNMMVFQHQREKSPTKPNKTKNCFLNSEQENYNKTGPSVRIFPTQKTYITKKY